MSQTNTPSFRSEQIDAEHIDQLVDMLDLQAAMPSIQRIRRWTHEILAVRSGERAVDIGSGTGSEVQVFAAAVGAAGDAVGVDPNPAMVAVAQQRAEGTSARFVEGSAYQLPFEDGSVDAVRCERVYQHLNDPEAATAEIARVLKPGGRVVLIDSDWSTSITHPGDPETIAALTEWMQSNTPNPQSGRRLRGRLARAGLTIDDIGSEAVIWDTEILTPMYRQMGERAVTEGVITEYQHRQLLSDLETGVAAGDYHSSVTMFAVLAHR